MAVSAELLESAKSILVRRGSQHVHEGFQRLNSSLHLIELSLGDGQPLSLMVSICTGKLLLYAVPTSRPVSVALSRSDVSKTFGR